MQTEIRRFAGRDVGFALTQTAREGWDSTRELFQACLTHDPRGCFVGLIDGNPVGIITTTRYQRTAWIGNLIVAPDKRKQGIGPWLALDPETAADLLAATLADFSDSAVVLGVPSVNAAVVSMLESHGMTPTPSSLRMIYGPSDSAGTPELIYAIGNGAMG